MINLVAKKLPACCRQFFFGPAAVPSLAAVISACHVFKHVFTPADI